MVLLVAGVFVSAYSQSTSRDNYTGDWENAASWTDLAPPAGDPAAISAANLDLTINGYVTRNGDINVAGATNAENFIVNDTLVIMGDVSFANDAAPLLIGPDAVLIVIGNASFGNNTVIRNDGIFVVSGNADFASGASEVYDDSGGGELFVQGNVTQNPDASGANDWGNLDDIYPVIYEFVMCGGGSSCVLPIRLSYFAAELHMDIVALKWATTMEKNFQKFVVQRSSDGMDFEDLGEVAGKGFNIHDVESKYFFSDKNPLTGFNYYRLKAVDLDGRYEYFPVRAVKVTAAKSVAVYPNPASGEFISFAANFSSEASADIVLVDQLGIEVFRLKTSAVQNTISFENKLRPGIYFLRYASNELESVTRVVVKN